MNLLNYSPLETEETMGTKLMELVQCGESVLWSEDRAGVQDSDGHWAL